MRKWRLMVLVLISSATAVLGGCSDARQDVKPTPIVLASFESSWCKNNSSQVLNKAESMGMVDARVDTKAYGSLDELKAAIRKNNAIYGWPRWHEPATEQEVEPFIFRWVANTHLAEVCREAYNER